MTAGSRTISVDYLSRVEGEGSLTIRLAGGVATEVRLSIFEPPRFFEALLRGRRYEEAPDITSRICGICPVAYLMSACRAMEDALGLEVPAPLATLRRLLYCGEWIASHALHTFLLHAPDLLGFPDAVSMAGTHRSFVQKGLRIKKVGNAVLSTLGGREVHPINVRVGGFYRVPDRAELGALLPELYAAADDTRESFAWMSTFPFPSFERDYEFVALCHPDEYPMMSGRIASSGGLDIDVRDYEQHFEEAQVSWSTALHSRLRGRGSYLCGPLARFSLNFERLNPSVKELAHAAGLRPPLCNPGKSLLVRMLEILQALEESIRIIETYTPPPVAAVFPGTIRQATGHGATCAPRGLLYHRYTFDKEGIITDARIVAPTSQNQRAIEEDLLAIAKELATLPRPQATARAEQTVRNHDPCISCATHFLTLSVEDA